MMTTASRLAWGIFLLGAAALPGCSSDDDSSGNNAGSGGSAGAGAAGGTGGMACDPAPTPTDHHTCADLPSVAKGDASFEISSPDFENCAALPTEDTCDGSPFGSGKSPKLTWTGVPAGTKSFALTFKDISITEDNASDPHGFHWVMWDIPADTTGLDGGMTGPGSDYHSTAVPGALQWSNLAYGFFPPCPNPFPLGSPMFMCSLVNDSYSFTLYALDQEKLTDLPDPDVDATSGMPTGNYMVKLAQYIETLPALGVTEYRATSHAWSRSFTPPTGAKYPCTAGNMLDGCLQ
jgi:phosphatidylethanolamine-binding protein (PEBP) family uncharacterized protein